MMPSAALSHAPRSVPLRRRIKVRTAVAAARLLATRSPERIRLILTRLHRNTAPASHARATTAHHEVIAVSLACAGPTACLARSLATVLLCRLDGGWATWCLGVRRISPFSAHAWVEADGRPVGEYLPPGYLQTFFTVPEQPPW